MIGNLEDGIPQESTFLKIGGLKWREITNMKAILVNSG